MKETIIIAIFPAWVPCWKRKGIIGTNKDLESSKSKNHNLSFESQNLKNVINNSICISNVTSVIFSELKLEAHIIKFENIIN